MTQINPSFSANQQKALGFKGDDQQKTIKHDIGNNVNNYLAAGFVGAGAGAGAAYLATPNPVKKFLPGNVSKIIDKVTGGAKKVNESLSEKVVNIVNNLGNRAEEIDGVLKTKEVPLMEKLKDIGKIIGKILTGKAEEGLGTGLKKSVERVATVPEELTSLAKKGGDMVNPMYKKARNFLAKPFELFRIKTAAKFAPLGALVAVGATALYKSVKGAGEE